jgi:anti-sigma B factor antagonist
MTFALEQSDPAIVTLAGDVLGGAEAMEFTRAMGELLRTGARRIVIDVSDVSVMNSSGLGMLVGVSTSIRSAGGTVVVAGANEKILGLFRMTRLDSVLDNFPSRQAALASWG